MRAWLAVVIVAMAAAIAPRPAAAQVLSPGPLSQAHANIEGDDDCSKCHESGNKVVARLCLDCHKDLAGELAAGRGLHGRQYRTQSCEGCHVEHVGRNTKLVRWPGGAAERLDHAQVGWPLDGGHAKVACQKCHTRSSPQGRPQYVATRTACAACHKDPHAGRFTTECQKCHTASSWQAFDRRQFDHQRARFPLTGKHTSVACEKCHTGTPPTWKPLAFATCDACHADPHKGRLGPQPCTACHDTAGWASGDDKLRANHPRLSLANGHAKLACKACHDRGNDRPPSRGSACEGCHRPIHVAKFSTRCEGCHASIKWVGLPDAVGRDNHGKTRYPLAGKHQAVACAACHPATRPVAQRYRQLAFAACAACHADPHRGARLGGDCARCHTVAGFAPTTFGIAEHAATRLPLDGKHVAVPCSGCHPGSRPRVAFAIGAKACADCHANPHGAQFDRELAAGGCQRCHTTRDWHQARIDHSAWPLDGAHARAACAACHGTQQKGAPPAAYRGIPRDCEGCHDDLHAGQFRQTAPQKRCPTCHTTASFRIAATFDHATTRLALDGKHRALTCDRCHTSEPLRNGAAAVRWRLGYVRCKDCHANPHKEQP